MRKLETVILGAVGSLILFVSAYLLLMYSALSTLEGKYTGLKAGMTVEETDRFMGARFSAEAIGWEDIPSIYTDGRTENTGGSVRDYQLIGLSGLNIIVLYDEAGLMYLKIPCYE